MKFQKALPIWLEKPAEPDEFAEFAIDLALPTASDALRMRVSVDSDYNLFLGDELLAFGQYADYPCEKIFDDIALPPLPAGNTRLTLLVWYYGKDTQTYINAPAGAVFEIYSIHRDGQETIFAASGKHIPARLSPFYISHRAEQITTQLGFNYHCDATAATDAVTHPYAPARVVDDFPAEFFPRPVEKTVLRPFVNGRITGQGAFTYAPDLPAARAMQTAALTHRPWNSYKGQYRDLARGSVTLNEPGGNCYVIVDLGEETVGFLTMSFDVPCDCDVEIGYGEHLIDGRCRTSVRNFTFTYRAHAGRNDFLGALRRLGARYLQLFVHADTITLHKLGLTPVEYPLTVKPYHSGNLLRDTIYEVCVRTLISCMHEHYEDCPWREQALYTMDSRNQMLCGYYAFGEQRFARAALHLMSHGMRPDGILTLCYPAGKDAPIPAFSLIYYIQMWEYIRYTGDTTLARELLPTLERLMHTFLSRRGADLGGLIENFHGEGGYWNFYEWSESMSGKFNEQTADVEAPLNAFLSLALAHYAKILEAIGETEKIASYLAARNEINHALAAHFYEADTHLFASFQNRAHGTYSVLTNALCLLCGAAEGLDTHAVLDILAHNGAGNTGLHVVPNTLSMNSFRFDALLAADRETYRPIILDEIDRTYLSMLRTGATTFYETIRGAEDFSDAGSLCHGWSALPIYYYETLA